jgi:hypothetical protein
MTLTRASSGLVRYDAFGSDTSASYNVSAGSLTVASGYMVSATTGNFFVYPTTAGVKCVSCSGYVVTPTGQYMAGLLINANSTIALTGDRDFYTLIYAYGTWNLSRYINNSETSLATDTGHDPASSSWNVQRLYTDGTTVTARYGSTTLANTLSAVDSTYASGYGGGSLRTTGANCRIDNLDLRTSHLITCSGLPAGSSVVVSDGTTTASTDTAAGAVSIDAGAVLFPLTSVTVYASTGGGGAVLGTITSATLTDMGGGDAYTYKSDTNHGFMMMKCGQA